MGRFSHIVFGGLDLERAPQWSESENRGGGPLRHHGLWNGVGGHGGDLFQCDGLWKRNAGWRKMGGFGVSEI